MYQTYMYLFYAFLVLAIVMFIFTSVLFFLLDIKRAIGEITGANKRKGVSRIFDKAFSENAVNSNSRHDSSQTPTTPQAMYDKFEISSASSGGVSGAKYVPKRVLYSPPSINQLDFSISADITFVHSKEIIK